MHILYLKPHNRNKCNRIASKRTVYSTGVSLSAVEKTPVWQQISILDGVNLSQQRTGACQLNYLLQHNEPWHP